MRQVVCPHCGHPFFVARKNSPGAGAAEGRGPMKLGPIKKLALVSLLELGAVPQGMMEEKTGLTKTNKDIWWYIYKKLKAADPRAKVPSQSNVQGRVSDLVGAELISCEPNHLHGSYDESEGHYKTTQALNYMLTEKGYWVAKRLNPKQVWDAVLYRRFGRVNPNFHTADQHQMVTTKPW